MSKKQLACSAQQVFTQHVIAMEFGSQTVVSV